MCRGGDGRRSFINQHWTKRRRSRVVARQVLARSAQCRTRERSVFDGSGDFENAVKEYREGSVDSRQSEVNVPDRACPLRVTAYVCGGGRSAPRLRKLRRRLRPTRPRVGLRVPPTDRGMGTAVRVAYTYAVTRSYSVRRSYVCSYFPRINAVGRAWPLVGGSSFVLRLRLGFLGVR